MRKPYNVFTTFLAVLGMAISILLYYAGQENRDPYYLVSDSVQVFNSAISLSSMKVKDKTGNPIKDSIYVTEISVWNAGKRPIESSDVRAPISIQLSKAKKIIEMMVIEQTEPEILAFSLEQSMTEPNAINISFKHLDPQFGAKIKLFYTGTKDPGVVIRGSILGAKFTNGGSLVRKFVSDKSATFLAALVGAVSASLMRSLETKLVSKDINRRRRRITKTLMVVVMLLACAAVFSVFFAPKIAPV